MEKEPLTFHIFERKCRFEPCVAPDTIFGKLLAELLYDIVALTVLKLHRKH